MNNNNKLTWEFTCYKTNQLTNYYSIEILTIFVNIMFTEYRELYWDVFLVLVGNVVNNSNGLN